MHTASANPAAPNFRSAFQRIHAAVKEEAVWPEGKEEPEGRGISYCTVGSATKGRSRIIRFFRPISPIRKVTNRETSIKAPYRLYF